MAKLRQLRSRSDLGSAVGVEMGSSGHTLVVMQRQHLQTGWGVCAGPKEVVRHV